jgi:hypothetical protein
MAETVYNVAKAGLLNGAIDLDTVDTDEEAADWSSVVWRIGDILEITGLTPVDGGDGVTVDVDLTAAQLLALPAGSYVWELVATVDGEVRTRGIDWFQLDPEPTTAP